MSFGGGSPAPITTPTIPTASDPAVAAAARQEQINASRARGRGATLLTGGMGIPTSSAPTQQKYLLGS